MALVAILPGNGTLVTLRRATLRAPLAPRHDPERHPAAPSRSTPAATTKRSAFPPRRPRGSRCAPSRSSATSPASPTSSIRGIERRAYEHQRAVEHHERIVVGVNDFVLAEEPTVPVATVDPALEADQVQRVQALRARRNPAEVARALATFDDDAAGAANLVTPIVGAVKALATVGEIADVMRKRFGEYHPAR